MLCSTCGAEFETNPRSKHGTCTGCRVKYNRARVSQSSTHYIKHLLVIARNRAKRSGVLFDLTKQQLLDLWAKQKGRCALTGVVMTFEVGDRRPREFNASLDRVKPGGPYTLDNVQFVCARANWIKGDLDNTALSWWITMMHDHQKG